MGWFNLGKKDVYGKQARIEHRGKHLHISRTGGTSLRAQTKAAGLNLTANSRHGVRVSRSVGKQTQVAMQNGRFIFRGRYGRGPNKLNLSKSGVTVSTSNKLGTFNWIKPNRSSAKVFGVQIRGKNAAAAQSVFMLLTLVVEVMRLAALLLLVLGRALWALTVTLWRLLSMTPFAIQQMRCYLTAYWVRREQSRLPLSMKATIQGWDLNNLATATTRIFIGWGRGLPADTPLPESVLDGENTASLQQETSLSLGKTLEEWLLLSPDTSAPRMQLAILAELAKEAASKAQPEQLPEILMDIDALALKQGFKSRFQEQMLEVWSAAAGLKMVMEEPDA